MNLQLIPIRMFSFDRQPSGTTTLVAELSTLESWLVEGDGMKTHTQPSGQRKVFTPPRTFTVHGESADITFTYTGADVHGEEVAGWWYDPAPGELVKLAGKKKVRVLIIND